MDFSALLEGIQQKADGAAALGSTLKFDFGDDKVFIDGTGDKNVVSSEDKEAACTLTMSPENFQKLVTGDLNPMMAVMSGKVKISGDMGLAMKIQSLL